MANSPFFEGEDFRVIYVDYVNRRRSIDELLEHKKFQKRLRELCYSYSYRSFHAVYGPEDLYGDSVVKVMASAPSLQNPDNVRGEDEFFDFWLPMVVYGVLCSSDRRLNRARRNNVPRNDEPVEELSLPAPPDDCDRKYILNLFGNSIKYLPEKKRLAIELWLKDFSYREIKSALYGEGSDVSHTTIRNWVESSIRTFKSELMWRWQTREAERIEREMRERRSRGGKRT